jgi:hypothetical protein
MSKQLKQWHYYDKVFRRWVVMFVGPFSEFQKEMELVGYDYYKDMIDSNGYCINFTPENNSAGNYATAIWLKKFDLDTLVHEIAHLVMYIFDDLLIPISIDNTETFAHYTEHWYRELRQIRKKYPNGNTPKQVKK